MPYTGYTGYDESSIKRQRQIADALMQRSLEQRGQPIQHWSQGVAQLAEALMARQADDRASRAEKDARSNRAKIADSLISSAFPGAQTTTAEELTTAKPFDLTPAGVQARNTTGTANDRLAEQVKAMAAMTGDPLGALQYGQGVQRQNLLDKRYDDEAAYKHGRDDVADRHADRQYDFNVDRAGAQDNQFDRTFEQNQSQFDARQGQDQTQFDATMNFNRDKLASDEAMEAAKLAAKTDGSAVFEGPQLATIYNKSMDRVNDLRAAQSNYDTIANASEEFLAMDQKAGPLGYNSQGEGLWNDVGQALSMDTTRLKALTNRIAPLMRQPGSGSSSDRDVEIYSRSVVNINNTREANQSAAKAARLMADRNRAYAQFLNQAVDPQDPQSLQKAEALWDKYKEDVRLFDPETKMPAEDPLSFDEWIELQQLRQEAAR